jgi:hypothetical protein
MHVSIDAVLSFAHKLHDTVVTQFMPCVSALTHASCPCLQVSGASNSTLPSVEASTHGNQGKSSKARSAEASPQVSARPAPEEDGEDNCSSGCVVDDTRA